MSKSSRRRRAEGWDTEKFNTRVNFEMLVKRQKNMWCRRKVRDEAEPKAETQTRIHQNSKNFESSLNVDWIDVMAVFTLYLLDATRPTIMHRTTPATKELHAKRPTIMGWITHTTKELDAKRPAIMGWWVFMSTSKNIQKSVVAFWFRYIVV